MDFVLDLEIGEELLEAQYRHVNHADLLRVLERARLAFLERIGCSSPALIATGVYPVITRIDVSYLREVQGGPARATCEEGRIVRKTMILKQRIFNHRDKEAVTAHVESMFIDGESRRAVEIPERLIQAFRSFYAQQGTPE
ncbi:MAG: thioesterase family protein [Oligoflexia bacterium]|nr:thioesterase family protein [Oligoflexia bacterium]